jgi:hypothetical protein
MKDTTQWDHNWRPIHIPTAENPNWLACDARIDTLEEAKWNLLLPGRSILTNAFLDSQAITGKESETFEALDLILLGSDLHDTTPIKENPQLGANSTNPAGTQKAPYGTALQILEQLVEEGLKLGAIGEIRSSELLRCCQPLTRAEQLPLHPAAKPKTVKKEDLHVVLGGKYAKYEGNPRCPITLRCWERIGVNWTNQEGKQEAWINPENPFVKVILKEDTIQFSQNPDTDLEFLCNPAFITLSKTDTKKAQDMLNQAGEETFFHHSQDCDQCHYDLPMFQGDYHVELDTLWNRNRLLQKAKEHLEKDIKAAMESYLRDTCPEVESLLTNRWKKGFALHLKFLQLKGKTITFDVTGQSKTDTLFIKEAGGKPITVKTKTRKQAK